MAVLGFTLPPDSGEKLSLGKLNLFQYSHVQKKKKHSKISDILISNVIINLFIIAEIQECQPFSALGFYSIDRSTLTATLGSVLTYFIILLQTITC